MDLKHPAVAARQLRLDGTVEVAGETTRLDLTGRGEALRLDKIGPDVLGDPVLSVKAALVGDALRLETATLDSKLLTLKAGGTGDLATSTFDMNLKLTAPDLAPMARAYGVEALGTIDLEGRFQQRGEEITLTAATELRDFFHPMADAQRLRVDGTVELQGPSTKFKVKGGGTALRLNRIGADLLPQAGFSAVGTLADTVLELQHLKLASPIFSAEVTGELDVGTGGGHIGYQLRMDDLAAIVRRYDIPLSGVLAMGGTATLPRVGAPRFDGELVIGDLAYDGVRYGPLQAQT